MNIKNLQINNFGKLKNINIELHNGINVIYGKNESGKSTLLKFITGMFYGLSKNKNGKRISDIEKYTPWEDGEFSGKISYKLDNNEEYEVYRNFIKKNPQVLDNVGNDVTKNYTIDKTNGSNFFTEQTRVDEDLFNMAMVIKQAEVKLDDKGQNALIQKASNIMLTGEDDVSYKNVLGKLIKKQNDDIGTEKSPTKPLYLLKKKIEELKSNKKDLENILNIQYEIDSKKATTEVEINRAEEELQLMQEIEKLQKFKNIEQEKININIKAREEAEQNKKEEENKLDNIKTKNHKNKQKNILYIIPCILIIISLILFLINYIIFSIITLAFAVIAAITIIINSNKNKKVLEEERRITDTLKNKIELLNNEIKDKEMVINQKQNELNLEEKTRINEIREKFSYTDVEQMINKEINDHNIMNEQKYLNDLKLNLTEIEMQKKDIILKLEKKSYIDEELENSEETLKELLEYNDEIELAKKSLENAYERMKENVTPTFTSNLSNIINSISKGKYKTVKVNDENGLLVETQRGNYVPADVLSTGTIDQLYLSLRISSINELTRENMPIILDETFAYFDEERLENILEFLNKEYEGKQIIILTCTNREIDVLEKMKVKYNIIEL